ncbi:MAG: discoidin domain-containing protein [Thermodesulfobacteriota bacterium]|nr:MAG: discoidin domain-containing protein [Thermodesulfobacteriota bacterium]
MKSELLDNFVDLSDWQAIASGQAQIHITPDQGPHGKAMRVDFDFKGGGGFVVARKAFSMTLPESYAFSFGIRGAAPSNIFEFKLMDESDKNVWRYREEALKFSENWQTLRIKSSQIAFAWGPLGGGPAREVVAIEYVIASGPGGKGTVWIDDLRFEDQTYCLTPKVQASSAQPGFEPQNVIDPSGSTSWRSIASDGPQQILIDFQTEREYGGLVVHWEKDLRPQYFDIQLSTNAKNWSTVWTTQNGVGERTYVYLPNAVSRFIRLNLRQNLKGRGVGIIGIQVKPYDFSRSINAFFGEIAKESPKGFYPKYLFAQQTYWTLVGTGEDITQALFNEEGMVEVDKGAFSIEPFLYVDDRLITWADVSLKQDLKDGYLPIPSSVWQTDELSLITTTFATVNSDKSVLYIRYRLRNTSAKSRRMRFFVGIRPFQVTPTWQNWHAFGGVSKIMDLEQRAGEIWVNKSKQVIPLTTPSQFGAVTFVQGPITEFLKNGELPAQTVVSDDFGYASGALRYDLDLTTDAVKDIFLAIPFGTVDMATVQTASSAGGSIAAEQFDIAVRKWEDKLSAFEIHLPAEFQEVVHTLKTAAAHILINRDGPAFHPGPRRYSRSWIRDGAMMGAALLRMGFTYEMRDFIRWYAAYQTDDGNLPDCADREGCEWLPEYDCWGQFIFAIMDYYRFSGDRKFLVEMWPAVLKSVGFMENLRGQRLTPAFQTPDKVVYYGLLPESMSHEGYMAHPVHAFWDDFWALRGLKDAITIAEVLGDQFQAQRLLIFTESFCNTLFRSLNKTIQDHNLDFVPGSVEFADFDPAATSVAISLLDQLHHFPQPATDQTFDKYLIGFRDRASGGISWNNYSAYEIRVIAALIRLCRRQDAHELLDFFLSDRRIPPWNQWPEISWCDPKGPSFIGDMPHSWISAEYILAIRSMFAYEREEDHALVIGAGIHEKWLTDTRGVVVKNLPTHYGKLNYTLRRDGPYTLRLMLGGDLTLPPGNIVIKPPLPRPLMQVEVNGRRTDAFDSESAICDAFPAEIAMNY